MLDLTVVILTYNEERHIARCIESVKPIAKRIILVDCFSTDGTKAIAESMGAEVMEHEWPGNQAEQFNWTLDHVSIQTSWVLRLDADEYLTPALMAEMQEKLPSIDQDVSAVLLPLRRAFQGRVLKHGIAKGVKMVRLFRTGKVRYEQRLMDEHLRVLSGKTIAFKGQFVDDSLIGIRAFMAKHNAYSDREAAMLLDTEYSLTVLPETEDSNYTADVAAKRKQKEKYAKMPLFWRSIGYFCYRYFIKLGLLDGKEGFLWDFFQGLWYRMLVDAKVYEAKKACGNDKEKLKKYIKENWKIAL